MGTAVYENKNALAAYEQKKSRLMAQLSQLSASHAALGLQKKTSNLFRVRKKSAQKINVKEFQSVICIDRKKLTADVEGMITYDALVKACLLHDCVPTVVPELKSITVGGALAGGAIESSSFRYGLVHENILEFEVLLSDGSVVLCTPHNEHRDLFYGFPNSYGSLGYALRVKLKLARADKYVQLSHKRYTDPELYFASLTKLCNEKKVDFVEGVIFDDKNLYITVGEFLSKLPRKNDDFRINASSVEPLKNHNKKSASNVKTSNYKYKNIYYRSIANKKTDYLTTEDYIWRWDTDWFWCSKFFYMQNKLLRLLFGKWVLKSTAFWKIRSFVNRNKLGQILLRHLQKNTEAVIQDVQIPIQNAAEFLKFFQTTIGIKPIWICPTHLQDPKTTFTFYPLEQETLYINFGFWDVVPSQQPAGYYNTLIENKVRELGGYKGLYSSIYYSEKEFWEIYNHDAYRCLKKQYDQTGKFKDLYVKCTDRG